MAPADPELRELVKEMNRSALAEQFKDKKQGALSAEGEIFPSAVLPVIATNRKGVERVFPMKWGFSMKGKHLLINARTETAAEKPAFREAWFAHRCIIPASWYYEWEHDEQNRPGKKYALRPETPGIIRLAGLYRIKNRLPEFVILTRPAADCISWMHNRMPLLLPEEAAKEWIKPSADPEDLITKCVTDISWQDAG